jgi:hypothetical protein
MLNNFKILSLLLILLTVINLSCKQRENTKKFYNKSGNFNQKSLVPYSKIFQLEPYHDTTLPNGNYLMHLVNQDTTDHTLYIKYGNKTFDSIYVIENGLELPLCHRYEVCYSTAKTLAINYQCITSRGLTILPLQKNRVIIELDPLYIGVKEGVTISFADDEYNLNDSDSLLLADLDFNRKQYIKINRLPCGERILCFEKVIVKGKKVYFTYDGVVPNSDPQTINQVEPINVIN